MSVRKQDQPLSERLAALSEAVPRVARRARECELAHRRVVAEIAQLTDAIADSYADNDEPRAAKASKQRAALEQAGLREAEERHEGAKRAVAKAEAERGLFVMANIDGLIAERRDDATAAALAVEDAVEQLGQAQAAWNAVESDVAALLRLAGRDVSSLPRFPEPLALLVRDARRADGVRVPTPIPGGAIVLAPREPVTPAA
jgi:hypothetical protein